MYGPCSQEEYTADSQVGEQHEEPDGRREGVQEGEVTRFTTLKHTNIMSPVAVTTQRDRNLRSVDVLSMRPVSVAMETVQKHGVHQEFIKTLLF